jgi:hypothetical protein
VSWRLENGVTACQQNATIDIYADDKLVETISINDACSSYGQFNVILPSCGPECEEENKPPIIDIKQIPSEPSLCLKKERRGAFSALLKNPFKAVNLEACYNSNKDKWQFKIQGNNTFYIEYYLEICIQNIYELHREKTISKIEELNLIPEDSVCIALDDFDDILLYGGGKAGHYYIVEATIEEEEIHRADFITIKNNLLTQNSFFENFLKLSLRCNEYVSIEAALQKGTRYYDHLLNIFREKLIANWEERIGKEGTLQRMLYEQEVNQKLNGLVLLYKEKLRQIYPNINCE